MNKYRVTFQTTVQIDGWTDYRDREYETVRGQVTVLAKNKELAKKIAIKSSIGYHKRMFSNNFICKWDIFDIKKIIRVKRTK